MRSEIHRTRDRPVEARVQGSGLRFLENSFSETSRRIGTPMRAIGLAGLPCTIVMGGTDVVTTLPAVTIDPRPMVTLGSTIAPGPTLASSSITTPRASRTCAMIVARMPTHDRSLGPPGVERRFR